jgi:hypothetical protein
MQLLLELELTLAANILLGALDATPVGITIDLANYAVNGDGSHDYDYPAGDKP